MTLNGAYLVETAEADVFRAAARELAEQHPGVPARGAWTLAAVLLRDAGATRDQRQSPRSRPTPPRPRQRPQISLVDLLDRLLGTGVVLAGDVVITLAGVDLVQVKLHALISSVRSDMAGPP